MLEFSSARNAIWPVRRPKRAPARKPEELPACEEVPAALGELVRALRQALGPVGPTTAFREGLARDLAALARQRKAPEIILQRPRGYGRQILIGAAVSSAVSVAGIIAIIWRHRAQVAQRAS